MTDTDRLDAWVAAGILSEEQAEEIYRFESERVVSAAPSGRVPLVAEALGYLGGGLAVVAALVLGVEVWDQLQPWAQVALVAIITAILSATGTWARNSEEPAGQRLATFLWFLSSIGVAFSFGLIAFALDAREEIVFLTGAAAAAVYSFVLWLLRRAALQQLALFGGIVATVLGFLGSFETNIDPVFFGLAVFAVSLAWGLLAWAEVVAPAHTGLVLSGLGMIAGAQSMLFDDPNPLGFVLGLAAALMLMVAGVVVQRTALLALGAGAVILFVFQLVLDLFGDAIAAVLTLLVLGLGIVVGAVVFARRKAEAK